MMTDQTVLTRKSNKSLREKLQGRNYLSMFLPMAIFLLFSCGTIDNPLAPVEEEITYKVENDVPNFLTNVSTSLGKKGQTHNGPPGNGVKWLIEKKKIDHKKGGKVGGKKTNNNMVFITPGALRKNTEISVSVPENSDYIFAEFGPSYVFKKYVKIEISYKNADLNGVNEDDLSIWYIDKSGEWVKVKSIVDKKRKVIIAWVNHFSRYGLSDD